MAGGGRDGCTLQFHERRVSMRSCVLEVRNLAINDDNKVSNGRADGIAPLVDVLRRHAGIAAVMVAACGVLINVTAKPTLITRAGSITPLVAVLHSHADCASLIVQPCGPLGNLAHDADCCMSVASEGGTLLLEAVLHRHAEKYDMRSACRWALSNLMAHAVAQ